MPQRRYKRPNESVHWKQIIFQGKHYAAFTRQVCIVLFSYMTRNFQNSRCSATHGEKFFVFQVPVFSDDLSKEQATTLKRIVNDKFERILKLDLANFRALTSTCLNRRRKTTNTSVRMSASGLIFISGSRRTRDRSSMQLQIRAVR